MATAATGLTQEQITFAKSFTNSIINDQAMQVMDGLDVFIENEREIVAATNDNNRVVARRLPVQNGSIGTTDAAGTPSGDNFYPGGDFYEQLVTMTEKVGFYTVPERNIGLLSERLASVNLSTDTGRATATKIFTDLGWGDYIMKDMMAMLKDAEKTALLAVLNALKTTQLYATDYIVANSGTLLGGDNLSSSAFGDEILDEVIKLSRGMETLRGLKVGFSVPKYFFTLATNLPDAMRLFNPSGTINDQQRQVLNPFGQKTLVDAVGFNADFSLAIGGAHGIEILMETAQPRILMNTDKYGNLTIQAKRVSGFGASSRADIIQIDHPS